MGQNNEMGIAPGVHQETLSRLDAQQGLSDH